MEIKLLGKNLSDYPNTDESEADIMRRMFPDGKSDRNFRAYQLGLSGNFPKEVYALFLMDGNAMKTTHSIIAMVRVVKELELLSDKQWEESIPFIERGLEANQAYVRMLDEISPILERYCKDYNDVNMRYTFMDRVHLECWQGRFSENHWANPNKEPNYK